MEKSVCHWCFQMETSQQLDTLPSLGNQMFTVPASVPTPASTLTSTFNPSVGMLPASLQMMSTPPQSSTLDIQQIGKNDRRLWLCENIFYQIKQPQHKLHRLLPMARIAAYNMPCFTHYSIPKVKPNLAKNCFIN